MNSNIIYRLRRNFLHAAVLAASVFAIQGLSAQPVSIPRYNNGIPRPPGAIAFDHLNQMRRPHQTPPAESANAAAEQTREALAFYQELQNNPATAVSPEVLANAKGLVIIDQWSGGAVVGASGGDALAMVKNADGNFSNPVFYSVVGASIGPRLGVSHVRTLAFVMTDKAAKDLANGKTVASNNLRAVFAAAPTNDGVLASSPDLVLYQTASGVDIGAIIASTSLALDANRNKAYYRFLGETPVEIIAGKVTTPTEARALLAAVNKPADSYRVAQNR